MNDQILNALNLGTIATWLMIIGVAILIYVSRTSPTTHKPHRTSRK